MVRNFLFAGLCLLYTCTAFSQQKHKPLRVGIAGLTHTHVHWILNRAHDGDIEIVGIAEANRELAARYLNQYKLDMSLLYPSLTEMLDKTKPEAVTAFNSIYEHLETVQACAPRKIHVMVEKPLAVSLDHAKQMEKLARDHNIYLLTNYETTWYPSHYALYGHFKESKSFGDIRKVVVHDGHQGPKEIGVNQEFLDWLTDPVKNGGGALIDFGCYGANLATWLMEGKKPSSVMAITQTNKPHVYPRVDDEATIVLAYDKAQCIIQASWNWPYSRKDIEVYGETGSITADKNGYRVFTDAFNPKIFDNTPLPSPTHDPFAYFASVIRGETKMREHELSSLENNMVVMEILEAARQSAREGKSIRLRK